MENVQRVDAAQRQHIQENRLKREARRLADWTGLRLSACQEIAARTFGATSWQALTKDPTFVPDEALPGREDFEGLYEQRYEALAKLLSEQLNICHSLAGLVAAAWQPTAISPAPALWIADPLRISDDWSVLHDFGQHPSVPVDAAVVLVLEPDAGSPDRYHRPCLVAIRRDRLGRLVHRSDVGRLRLPESVQTALRAVAIQTPDDDLDAAQLKALHAAVKKAEDLGFEAGKGFHEAGSVQLKARWLTEPRRGAEVVEKFAQFMPWKHEDYPGIKKGEKQTFWRMQEQQIAVSAAMLGEIFIDVHEVTHRGTLHSQVQVGVGGLRHLGPDEADPGYYLVKYGTQRRSPFPIRGMDEQLATKVRAATGLGEWEETPLPFFGSDAGLGLAKWAASFPRRAKSHAWISGYTGDWLAQVKRRMEYELVRADLLN